MNSISCEPVVDAVHALGAAEWARAFYPDLMAEIESGRIIVSSPKRSEAELSLIWKVALANEKLQSRGQARRDAVLCELLA